ncbi:MAG: hypothetical protein GXP16_08460 [Gammaproteobacteria bacterium]|nr:hypothetical protein [Gammaproteobacteria bacterium]
MSIYRILTLDGGGLRGVITTAILKRIVSEPGCEAFLDNIDLVAGTSTGGLIALGIANKTPLEDIHNLYLQRGDNIFDDSFFDNIKDVGKLFGADYKTRGLKKELVRMFGATKLGALKKRVLIPSFDLENKSKTANSRAWKPKLFHNFVGAGNDRAESVVNVGLYTSAAPTFFPSVDGYIDGGVYANNPSMCALAQSQQRKYKPTPALPEIRLLSLGTGEVTEYIPKMVNDWGYAQWAKPLLSLMMDGVAGIADYQCQQLLGDHYHRLSPLLNKNYKIDDHKRIKQMEKVGIAADINKTVKWIKQNWM